MKDGKLEIGGHSVGPGKRAAVPLDITSELNGSRLVVWAHVLHGSEPGPVLALLSTLHGGEWFSIAPLRQIILETDPKRLKGSVIVVPVANPPALRLKTRNMPDESDSPDLNRVFPGPLTWTSDQIAAAVTYHVLTRATHLMDFHMGPWGAAFRDILIAGDVLSRDLSDATEELALAFGSPVIRRADIVSRFPGPRSSIGYAAGVLEIPAMGVEVGGAGFGSQLEARWRTDTVNGVYAVMGSLGMIDDPPDPRPERQLVYRRSHRVNPTVGGFLRSRFGGADLGKEVDAGAVLGEVYSPYTFDLLEELRAPARGLLFYTARDYPVNPGDWAFGIADIEDKRARWVEKPRKVDVVS